MPLRQTTSDKTITPYDQSQAPVLTLEPELLLQSAQLKVNTTYKVELFLAMEWLHPDDGVAVVNLVVPANARTGRTRPLFPVFSVVDAGSELQISAWEGVIFKGAGHFGATIRGYRAGVARLKGEAIVRTAASLNGDPIQFAWNQEVGVNLNGRIILKDDSTMIVTEL